MKNKMLRLALVSLTFVSTAPSFARAEPCGSCMWKVLEVVVPPTPPLRLNHPHLP